MTKEDISLQEIHHIFKRGNPFGDQKYGYLIDDEQERNPYRENLEANILHVIARVGSKPERDGIYRAANPEQTMQASLIPLDGGFEGSLVFSLTEGVKGHEKPDISFELFQNGTIATTYNVNQIPEALSFTGDPSMQLATKESQRKTLRGVGLKHFNIPHLVFLNNFMEKALQQLPPGNAIRRGK